jgi:2-polyprenyl-3-methyl-5-hydroxy-6-metoxy-1,4-benzoquinol methylase
MHIRRNDCRLCGGLAVIQVIEMGPIPVSEHYLDAPPGTDARRFPIDVYQCSKCSAVQTQDEIDPTFLWADYTYYSGQTAAIVRHFSDVAGAISEITGGVLGKSVFDIGSNDGTLLDSFRSLGARVWGIDPADSVIQLSRARHIKTYKGLFGDVVIDEFDEVDRCADIITAFNVFAHCSDMPSMCRGVRKMLNPRGVFAFEVQYLGDISRRKILGTFFHEHMIHYSAISAEFFLRAYGLQIFDYQRNNIQMGSIVFFATHLENEMFEVTPRFKDLLKAEREACLDTTGWADDFNGYLDENRNLAGEFLDIVRRTGGSVAAYGGARSGPSLLIQFGLDEIIDVIFDDHKDKVGRFCPFRGLPVKPTSMLSPSEHPYCIVTAYLHIKPILRNLNSYLSSGGLVIALWPRFTVIDEVGVEPFLAALEVWMNEG